MRPGSPRVRLAVGLVLLVAGLAVLRWAREQYIPNPLLRELGTRDTLSLLRRPLTPTLLDSIKRFNVSVDADLRARYGPDLREALRDVPKNMPGCDEDWLTQAPEVFTGPAARRRLSVFWQDHGDAIGRAIGVTSGGACYDYPMGTEPAKDPEDPCADDPCSGRDWPARRMSSVYASMAVSGAVEGRWDESLARLRAAARCSDFLLPYYGFGSVLTAVNRTKACRAAAVMAALATDPAAASALAATLRDLAAADPVFEPFTPITSGKFESLHDQNSTYANWWVRDIEQTIIREAAFDLRGVTSGSALLAWRESIKANPLNPGVPWTALPLRREGLRRVFGAPEHLNAAVFRSDRVMDGIPEAERLAILYMAVSQNNWYSRYLRLRGAATHIRVAAAAAAAARAFRLREGRWPASVAELGAEYEVPEDANPCILCGGELAAAARKPARPYGPVTVAEETLTTDILIRATRQQLGLAERSGYPRRPFTSGFIEALYGSQEGDVLDVAILDDPATPGLVRASLKITVCHMAQTSRPEVLRDALAHWPLAVAVDDVRETTMPGIELWIAEAVAGGMPLAEARLAARERTQDWEFPNIRTVLPVISATVHLPARVFIVRGREAHVEFADHAALEFTRDPATTTEWRPVEVILPPR